ncbi:cytidine deaminase-like [Teleopsis dalmanni]|uniref:cytidine deaminase-like n=1 Tax=Teleopsis dalmanni TaxID=139649 RepID=UPI0018CED509|nr:cytidine deaminase-like [Teleopsis dalmanni]XP_037936112.1 cytidine deaminase-like [Teleopsis dalmanni]
MQSCNQILHESTKNYCELDDCTKELIRAAIAARKQSYSPYSKFKVGSAFRTKSGRIFSGCNVENVAFSPTCCAERTALLKAISEGEREFVAGAVVAYQESGDLTTPCGVCRQFIVEFANEDIALYITNDKDGEEKQNDDEVLCTSIYNLLPYGFSKF